MSRNLTPRQKGKKTFPGNILPLGRTRSFQFTESSSNVKEYTLIIFLLFLLHLILTGRFIPKIFVITLSLLTSPILSLFTNHGPPSSITQLVDPKFLGAAPFFGLTSEKYVIPEKEKYILPRVEDLPALKKLGYEKLFDIEDTKDRSNRKTYLYSPDYFELIDENSDFEKDSLPAKGDAEKKSKNDNQYNQAIINFKRNGHRVYKGNENPEIVIVTVLNYEKFNPSLITKIAQNRIDYAYHNSYGVYARYAQEFIPFLIKSRNDLDNWSKLITMKEAMFAFPNAKWFWYVDEKTLIMRNDIDIKNYILKREALEPILLRGQSLTTPADTIKTYTNVDVEKLSFLVTPNEVGLNTDSFLVKNDLHGRSLLDIWINPLMRSYPPFRKDISRSLIHILQWHPLLLERTGLIPSRTIASAYEQNEDSRRSEEFIYQEGDLVINFPKCKEAGNCEQLMSLVDRDQKV